MSSLCDLAFASSASFLQTSLTKIAKKKQLYIDFTKIEITKEKYDDFKKVIQSDGVDAIIEYYKPLRRLLAVTKVKTCYKKLFGTPWSHDNKNSWLWFFYQNIESETLSFQFQDLTKEMNVLKYQYLQTNVPNEMECKRINIQGMPFESNLPIEELEEHQIRLMNFLDKFPNLEEFRMINTHFRQDSDLKLRIMLAVSNFKKLKTLTLPAMDENDGENFNHFLKWAPVTIQSLNLEFHFKDIDMEAINFLNKILKSLTKFKNLLALGLDLNGFDFTLDEWKKSIKTMKKIKLKNPKLTNNSALLIEIIDGLDENEKQIDWVKHIRISSGHMFLLRLIDKLFKDVLHLEVNNFFDEPHSIDGVPFIKNLQNIRQLNVHYFFDNGGFIIEPKNIRIIELLTLFPTLEELSVPFISLIRGAMIEDIPISNTLKKLIVTLSLIRPPWILTRMPNLTNITLRGRGNSRPEDIIRELEKYAPLKCDVTFEPFPERSTFI